MGKSIENLLIPAVIKLYDSERFYGELLIMMDKKLSKSIPTAGVRITKKIELFVNPDYYSSLTLDKQVAILKHECQHILNDHISRAKELQPDVYDLKPERSIEDNIIANAKHRILNIAADCAINGGIKDIGTDGVSATLFDLAEGQTFEWYFENLKNNQKANEFAGDIDHSLWGESEIEKALLKERVKQLVAEAARKTRQSGHMTASDELLVSRLFENTMDWRQVLSRFASSLISTKIDTSRKKRNRRYGIAQPGMIKTESLHIGVAIDTSGSISDDQLQQFMAEIRNISKYAVVNVVEADSEVKSAYLFDPKKEYTVKGRGGTAYQPAFDFFNENLEIDALIYFGDMDCFDSEEINKPKYPVLWAVVGEQEPPAQFGSILRIKK